MDGLNRYAYVGNNPLRYTDPTGHWKHHAEAAAAKNGYKIDYDDKKNPTGTTQAYQTNTINGGEGTVDNTPPIQQEIDIKKWKPYERERSGDPEYGDILYGIFVKIWFNETKRQLTVEVGSYGRMLFVHKDEKDNIATTGKNFSLKDPDLRIVTTDGRDEKHIVISGDDSIIHYSDIGNISAECGFSGVLVSGADFVTGVYDIPKNFVVTDVTFSGTVTTSNNKEVDFNVAN